MSDHPWISKSGRLWSPRVRSDLCAKCGRTPDAHPFPVPRWLSEAIALANRVLDRPHEDPDSDMAILARGVVRLREAHEPCACGREAALAQPSEPGLDEERLARALCIDAESIESDPVDFDVCPDREGHIEYAKALLAIAAALRQEVGNG